MACIDALSRPSWNPQPPPGPGFLREEHMSPISVLLSQHAIKAKSLGPDTGPSLWSMRCNNTTHSALDLVLRALRCTFLEYRHASPDISAPLTSNIVKSGPHENLKHDLCPRLHVLSSVKQLTQSSPQLAFVNPACLAGFPLKRAGIINTSLEDIPPAKGNNLALSLNQQWGVGRG